MKSTIGQPRTKENDDADVIRRSLTEPDHFTALYDRHAPAIHRYAARRLGTDVADDLMAEPFLIAFRKRRSYDLTYPNARPWLYGIVTRLIARQRKAETAQYRLLARLGGQAVAEPADRFMRTRCLTDFYAGGVQVMNFLTR